MSLGVRTKLEINKLKVFISYAGPDVSRWSHINNCLLSHTAWGDCKIIDITSKDQFINLTLELPDGTKKIFAASCIGDETMVHLVAFPAELDFEAMQATMDAKKSFDQFKKIFWNRFEQIFKSNIDIIPKTPIPTDADIRLAWLWKDGSSAEKEIQIRHAPLPDLRNNTNPDWERMLSARVAEKAALEYYSSRGRLVDDISITQLDPGNDGMYKKGDLRVDLQLIDVKNARVARNRDAAAPQHYVEQCLPRFKAERNGSQVLILGTLSDLLSSESILAGAGTVRILGTVSQTDITELKRHFDIGGQLSFSFNRYDNFKKKWLLFLPSWAYSYLDSLYQPRDLLLSELFSFDRAQILEITHAAPLPFALANGKTSFDRFSSDTNNPAWEKSFCDTLVAWVSDGKHQHALPFLFASILNHFIRMTQGNSEDIVGFSPQNYRKFLFIPGHPQFPLLIYDPLETINSMINNLDILWKHNRLALRDYRIFTLRNALILKAYKSKEDSIPTTLISYCGGLMSNGSACGYYPLIAGKHEPSPDGHYLKCPKCGFCSSKPS